MGKKLLENVVFNCIVCFATVILQLLWLNFAAKSLHDKREVVEGKIEMMHFTIPHNCYSAFGRSIVSSIRETCTIVREISVFVFKSIEKLIFKDKWYIFTILAFDLFHRKGTSHSFINPWLPCKFVCAWKKVYHLLN